MRTPEQLKRHRDYERERYQAMTPAQRTARNKKKTDAKQSRLDASRFEPWQVAVALKVLGEKE